MRPLLIAAVVTALAFPNLMATSPESVVSPRDEAEEVLNAGLPFAQRRLGQYGEFFPFGFAMTSKGKVVAVPLSVQDEHPPSQTVIDELNAAFKAGASSGEYKATGLFVDVLAQPPGKAAKTDGVRVSLEHRSGYCVDVFVPYSRGADGKIVMGESFASKRNGTVFGTCK
jgi:hypothetical protein